MSKLPLRLSAAIAYIPIIGWLYVLLAQRGNPLAVFHLKQSIGLVLFLIATLLAWMVATFVLAWVPLLAALGIALFTVVMAVYIYGVVAWIMGLIHALNDRATPLPVFGRWASRLPIG